MHTIVLKDATPNSPYLNLNPQSGLMDIKGIMIPENSHTLFDPIVQWVDEYLIHPSLQTELNIQLEYFNTRSSKFLLDIFRKFEKLYLNKHKVIVNWICDEDDFDMIEAGEDYQAIVKLPFNIIEIKE